MMPDPFFDRIAQSVEDAASKIAVLEDEIAFMSEVGENVTEYRRSLNRLIAKRQLFIAALEKRGYLMNPHYSKDKESNATP